VSTAYNMLLRFLIHVWCNNIILFLLTACHRLCHDLQYKGKQKETL
jgi:hypothetical protein